MYKHKHHWEHSGVHGSKKWTCDCGAEILKPLKNKRGPSEQAIFHKIYDGYILEAIPSLDDIKIYCIRPSGFRYGLGELRGSLMSPMHENGLKDFEDFEKELSEFLKIYEVFKL